ARRAAARWRGAPPAYARRPPRARRQVRAPVAEDPGQVFARLGDVRNAPGLVHTGGPCVVGGDRERQVAVIAIEHATQVPHTTLDVVLRQERILDTRLGRSFWHELHQALRSLG